MLSKAIASNLLDVDDAIRSLPRDLNAGDYFTGAATFHLVMRAALSAFKKSNPKAAKHMKAGAFDNSLAHIGEFHCLAVCYYTCCSAIFGLLGKLRFIIIGLCHHSLLFNTSRN